MAYESMTYEVILQRMIDRVVAQYPNIDNREGSILFNALAPAAVELAILYSELDNAISESFVDTATREYILLACKQMGIDITQFEASAGVHKGEFDVQVPIGSRWNCELYNYTVTEYLGTENGYYIYRMDCDTVGTAPNNVTGDLVAITHMPTGLTHAKVVDCLIDGENETSDEEIKTTYYNYLSNSITDGNVAQYNQWCNEYDGIGNYKILPLWNGPNTVKVSILSTSNEVASSQLISDFQTYLDPGSNGMGDGVAPIGAIITVSTASEVQVNVSATITMANSYTDTTHINTALQKYFNSIAYSNNLVSYFAIAAVILDCDNVQSVNNVLVNGSTADIILGNEEIPVLGTTNWTVV